MITFLIACFNHFVFLGPTYIWQGAKSPVITVAEAEVWTSQPILHTCYLHGSNQRAVCSSFASRFHCFSFGWSWSTWLLVTQTNMHRHTHTHPHTQTHTLTHTNTHTHTH